MPIATVPPSAPRTAVPTDTSTPMPIATEVTPPSVPQTATPTDTSTQTATPENMLCEICHQQPKSSFFPNCWHYIYCNDCLKTVSSCGRCGEKK
eukprot:c10106_g1_i5.p1 GENE.c10106_g1_i5~~c10106_g1_i5.p1  ORF type:complete len:102 (-),score=17.46 c10106_g1_i5:157-438(-)